MLTQSTQKIRLLPIGERILSLRSLPATPEESWRRTDPADFFIAEQEVINNFGQPVIGSLFTASPYKIQFREVSPDQLKDAVSRLLGLAQLSGDESSALIQEERLVLLELNNGGLTVASCAAANVWAGRLEIASRPARPDVVMRDSAIAAALSERLQVCAPSELVLKIPRLDCKPVVLLAIENDPAFKQSYANVTVELADQASADVAVFHGNPSFAHHRLTFQVGRNAKLTQLWGQFAGDDQQTTKILLERHVKLSAQSVFEDASVFVPSGSARVLSHIRTEGEGAQARCGAAIVASGQASIDYEPLQDHVAPQAQTHLRAKMLAGQRGKAVFQGLIHVEKEAVQTTASQVNKNLLLSKRARVDSMPRLRILPDEVSCKHGSATGEIDSKQMYYLQTRGLSEQQAREQIVGAFMADGLAHLVEDSLLDIWARHLLSQGLSRVLG